MMKKVARVSFGLLASFVVVATPAFGQDRASDYPSKAVRFIVPHSAGGLSDTIAREIAQHLSKRFGRPVVVENKPGASEAIGVEAVAKASPDGHTLLIATEVGLIFNPLFRKSLPYDPLREIAPVSPLFRTPFYLVVNPKIPAQSVPELIAYAKAHPGDLTFASIGRGSMHHMVGEMFKSKAKISLLHIPYKGSGPATADVVGGQVDMMFQGGASILPYVRGGKLRALASTTRTRTAATPELPTMVESGLHDFEVTGWLALFTTAGTPRPIIDRINREVGEFLRLPETQKRFAPFGGDLTPGSADDLRNTVLKDTPFWTNVVKEAGIQPE